MVNDFICYHNVTATLAEYSILMYAQIRIILHCCGKDIPFFFVSPKDISVGHRALRVSKTFFTIYGVGWGGGIPVCRENMAKNLYKIEILTLHLWSVYFNSICTSVKLN